MSGVVTGTEDPWRFLPRHPVPTDHSTFFDRPFVDGPSVTRACLECHPKAARDIMRTAHWNLLGDEVQLPGHEEPLRIGKRNLINNFCIGIRSNWPGCTSCHIGFGWADDTFDFSDETLVDCLVCHEQTGTYHKDAGDAGLPAADVDLLAAAQSVGLPTRSNCGACHFLSGGGNAVKHGDLDESLLFPNPDIDVHMGRLGFHCIDCHQAEDHLPPGRLLTVSVDDENRLFCVDCHKGEEIHGDRRIDGHTDRVACQTCHIPVMAFKEGTKMSWDWSEAGQDLPITDEHLYLKIKGRFTWVRGAQPEYAWYNGTASRYLLGDRIEPDTVTKIAAPLGDREDPKAKLHPFKIHRGKQVYDTEYRHFILPHVFGDKGFWTRFDWDEAIRIGSDITGLPSSGRYDFAPTEMYLPQNHMVVAKDKALQCPDCHGERGRLHWQLLGYPGDPVARPDLEHEPIPLVDADGELVHESGNPLSTIETCSQCHEVDDETFIRTHAYHSAVDDAQLPLERRELMELGPRTVDPDADTDISGSNCFLCHLRDPDLGAWQAAKRSGNAAWAISATLLGTGLLEAAADGYRWNVDALDEDELATIGMAYPRPSHCGACHGLVHTDDRPLTLVLGSGEAWNTEVTGQVFSAQRINQSALNLRDKDALGQAWDIHAQRMVECRDCHYARRSPGHLIADDRAAETVPADTLRACVSCHSDGSGHDWLPERDRHFTALACEACHIPQIHLPARQQTDASVVTGTGDYLVSYRGLASGEPGQLGTAYVTGYRPLLLKQADADGRERWTPVNLVSRWYWVDAADGSTVSKTQLQQAWLDDGGYRPQITLLFDADGDGRLQDSELHLDTPNKVRLITRLLSAQGVARPELRAVIDIHHLHHNVSLTTAQRDCGACHEPQLDTPFRLADYVPGGVLPDASRLQQTLDRDADGRLVLPRPATVSARALR